MKPVLHLMTGLPCSGKTTYAKELASKTGALLLTPDVWHIALFGHDMEHPEHDRRHDAVEAVMWDTAQRVLRLGLSVILDFGFWSRSERDTYREWAKKAGVGFAIHYMDTPVDELFGRLEKRNTQSKGDIFTFGPELLRQWMELFEPPTEDEQDVTVVKCENTKDQ